MLKHRDIGTYYNNRNLNIVFKIIVEYVYVIKKYNNKK